MNKDEILSMLEIIDQQMSSSILGGMEEKYEELERLGFVVIHKESIQHSASMTQRGRDFLQEHWRD